MFARIEDNTIVEYPLTETTIRQRFSNVSFSANFSSGLPEGYVRVLPSSRPVGKYLISVEEGTPELTDGAWVQAWNAVYKTAEEIAQIEAAEAQASIDAKWQSLRDDRTALLQECDWTQLSDAPISAEKKAEWATYRQLLRDLPENTSDIDNISWPEKP